MSIIDKSTKQAEWFPKAVGSRRGENTELTFNEHQLSFWHDKKKKSILNRPLIGKAINR